MTIGWWVVPTLITVAALTWAVWRREPSSYGGFGDFGELVNMFWFLIALVPILASWLIWSLL